MLELMIAEVIIKAIVLSTTLYLIARHEADFSFSKVSMVVAGIVMLGTIFEALLKPQLAWLTFIPVLVMVAAMVKSFCWVSWPKAMLATVVFVGFSLGLSFVAREFVLRVNSSIETPMEASARRFERIQNEIFSSLSEGSQGTGASDSIQAADMVSGVSQPPQPKPTAGPIPPSSTPGDDMEIPPDWKAARQKISIGGSIRSGKAGFVAIINGKAVQPGQRFSTTHAGKAYVWMLRSVTKQETVLEPVYQP